MKAIDFWKKAMIRRRAAIVLLTLPMLAAAREGAAVDRDADLSVGIDPELPELHGVSSMENAPPKTSRTSLKDWKFGFHGFFRAPLRISFDKQPVYTYPTDADGVPNLEATPSVSDDWRTHMGAALPDTYDADWKYTGLMGGPRAEMMFSYGNSMAVGHVSLAADNITDSSWRNLQMQLGIDQAFVTLNFPRAFKSRGGLTLNAGIFSNRYGGTGRYDAGRYETYIFGLTHTAGETLTARIHLTDKISLVLEHGFGAKTDVLPGNAELSSDIYNYDNTYDWVPYAGQDGQLPVMVNHAHAGLAFHSNKVFEKLMINGHFLHAFSKNADTSNGPESLSYEQQDGKQIIAGAELKVDGAIFGDVYLGFSTMKTDGLSRMPDAIEVLHSPGGWSMLHNFYGDMGLRLLDSDDEDSPRPNPGTGRINTLAWQYQLSLARLLWFTVDRKFFGQAPDLTISTWGMMNFVNPDDDLEPDLRYWAEKKLKVGGEAVYTPFKYFSFGLRFDRVMPDLDYEKGADRDSVSSYAPFTVLSPKLQFRTSFISLEEVTIQYSRYFWDDSGLSENEYRNSVRSENPHKGERADRNAFMVSVNMWW